MSRYLLPSLGREDKAVRRPTPLGVVLETKDAQTRRASQGSRGVYAYPGQPYTPPGANFDRLVKDGYEKVIWAFRGIDAIADKMSSWPIQAVRMDEEDSEKFTVVKGEPIVPLLNTYTNIIERSAKYFRYRLISQLLLSKKGVFIEVITNRMGQPTALNLLPPGLTNILPDPDTFIGGFRVDLPTGSDVPYIDLPAYDPEKQNSGVIWIRKPHPSDPYSSTTPLEAAGISLDLDFYARLYNRNFLLNDGRAGQIVAVKGGLSPEDANELKSRFSPGMAGAGRTSVIEADDVSVSDTAVSPRDAQYAELRDITKNDILLALGTPESVLGNAKGETFDNADADKENWLDVTVLPLSGVVEAGFDVLTKGGYDDEVRVKHNVGGEPVLRRRLEAKIDKARLDQAMGRISVDEWRDIAQMDELKLPGATVIWIPAAGKVAVGKDQDEASQLKPIAMARASTTEQLGPDGQPVGGGGPVAGGGFGGDLTPESIDQILNPPSGTGASGMSQATPTALQAAAAELDLELKGLLEGWLEEKAFNVEQPRYPMGTPQGGQFMSLGDIALWLAGKPLSTGVPASQVVDPNTGSTAQAPTTSGGAAGAARFLGSTDPAVRAAAGLLSFPAGYKYARVLGAPPARDLASPSMTKLVSLRKGDVVTYQLHSGGPWTVASAKKKPGGHMELELVNAAGGVTSVTAGQSQTIQAVARTPHPTVVAQAKRDVAAAAGAPAGVAPVPASGVAAAQAAAVSNLITSSGAQRGTWTMQSAAAAAPVAPPVPAGVAAVAAQAAAMPAPAGLGGPAGPVVLPSSYATATPAQPAGFLTMGMIQPGAVFVSPAGNTLTINPQVGSATLAAPGGGSKQVQLPTVRKHLGPGTTWRMLTPPTNQTAPTPAAPAAAAPPALAVGDLGPWPTVVPATYRSAQPMSSGRYLEMSVLPNGAATLGSFDPKTGLLSQNRAMTVGDVARQLQSPVSGRLWQVHSVTPAPSPLAPIPGATPVAPSSPAPYVPTHAAPPPPPPAPTVPHYSNLPAPQSGETVYLETRTGKVAYVDHVTGRIRVFDSQGGRATTNANGAQLAAGRGAWRPTPNNQPPAGPVPPGSPAAKNFAASPRAGRPGFAPAPAAVQAPTPVAVAPTPAPVAAMPPAAVPAPAPPAPAVQVAPSSGRAAFVVMAGVPTVTVLPGWSVVGGQSGSNPAAMMADPTGQRFYVKSQDAKHADNEVTAAMLYRAAGVEVPTVSRATLASSGMFPGQTGHDGIASEVIAGSSSMSARMQSDLTFRDAVLSDFAVHAWLGNWDAVENDNTIVVGSQPVTVDVGGAVAFRARGQGRVLPDKVEELTKMRGIGGPQNTAARTFRQLTPDSTDARFVAGVQRIAAISPDQIKAMVDVGMPSFSPAKRKQVWESLIARREYLAGQAKVVLPEKAHPSLQPAAPSASAAAAVTPTPAPNASMAALLNNLFAMSPGGNQAPAPSSHPMLTIPTGYAYPVVAGAPVATALPTPKPIKVASLRKGDVISQGGQPVTVVSVDRASGTVTALNAAGQTVTVPALSKMQLAIARTPHPTLVAAARRQMAGTPAGVPAPAPAAPAAQAPNVLLTTPAVQPGGPATTAAQAYGSAQAGGYDPIPGQTYASTAGIVLTVHSDGSGTVFNQMVPTGTVAPPAAVAALLSPGQPLVPVGPVIRTPQSSHVVGRYSSFNGDVLDVHPDGSGTARLTSGQILTQSPTQVDTLMAGGRLNLAGPSPHLGAAATTPTAPTGPVPPPAGGWVAAGQVMPGAVFVNPSGATLTIGPRGGGKFALAGGGGGRNMSNAQAQSLLGARAVRNQWSLATPSPQAQLNGPVAGPATPASQAATGPWPNPAPGTYLPSSAHASQAQVTIAPDGSVTLSTAIGPPVTVPQLSAVVLSLLNDPSLGYTYQPFPPVAAPKAPTAPSAANGGPVFTPITGQKIDPAKFSFQDGQTFTSPSTGNTIVINGGTATWTAGPKSKAATRVAYWNLNRAAQAMKSAVYNGTSGPDIDQPGKMHASAVRRAARMSALPAVDVPFVAQAPIGKTYPPAATGPASPVSADQLSRGQTVSSGGDSWVLTEVIRHGNSMEVWGYRPGKDDPNTITRQPDGTWKQGAQIKGIQRVSDSVDAVDGAPVAATNTPSSAQARPFDPSLPAPSTASAGAAAGGPPFDVVSQLVPADQLKAGDAILINGRENEGLFTVTKIDLDYKGRQAVYGYNGSVADATGNPGVEDKLFLASPSGTVRQTRVQVNGAPTPLPEVPRPIAPQPASGVERSTITDPTTAARISMILNSPPPRLPQLASVSDVGDQMMGHLQDARGYNGHPDVISEAEMDQYVQDGEIELWRGMQNRGGIDVAEEYRSGRHYPGGTNGSQFGTGTYAAYGQHAGGSRDSIKFVKQSYGSGSNAVMVRLTIKPDARVIEWDTLMAAYRADHSADALALKRKVSERAAVGQYAVLLGYDIIRKSHGYQNSHGVRAGAKGARSWDDGFCVILNRSAVRISEKNYVPDSNASRAPAGASPPPMTMSQARHKMDSLTASHENGVDYRVVKEP